MNLPDGVRMQFFIYLSSPNAKMNYCIRSGFYGTLDKPSLDEYVSEMKDTWSDILNKRYGVSDFSTMNDISISHYNARNNEEDDGKDLNFRH